MLRHDLTPPERKIILTEKQVLRVNFDQWNRDSIQQDSHLCQTEAFSIRSNSDQCQSFVELLYSHSRLIFYPFGSSAHTLGIYAGEGFIAGLRKTPQRPAQQQYHSVGHQYRIEHLHRSQFSCASICLPPEMAFAIRVMMESRSPAGCGIIRDVGTDPLNAVSRKCNCSSIRHLKRCHIPE